MKKTLLALLLLAAFTAQAQITSVGSAALDIVIADTVTLTQNVVVANNVRIEAGGMLILDPPSSGQILKVGSMTVLGTLKTNGVVQGSNGKPTKLKITIDNIDDDARTLIVDGGKIQLQGDQKEPWMFLSETTDPSNAGWIKVRTKTGHGWLEGDEVAIASTDLNPSHYEKRIINRIVTAGDTTYIRLNEPLTYTHYGLFADTVYSGEVVNTTRSILITGSPTVNETDDGPDLFIPGAMMNASGVQPVVQLSGVQFDHMGQRGLAGRYPVHLHHCMTFPSDSSYINYCAVTNSNHRGYVIHATDNIVLNKNVLVDFISHGYTIGEDGKSEDVVVTNNIALGGVTIDKESENFAFPTTKNLSNYRISGVSWQQEINSGAFWITNGNNFIRNNRAAGGESQNGFFWDLSLGRRLQCGGCPQRSDSREFGEFRNNYAHSYTQLSNTAEIFLIRTAYQGKGWGFFADQDTSTLEVYAWDSLYAWNNNAGGLWIESPTMRVTNFVGHNNGTGANIAAGELSSFVMDRTDPTGTAAGSIPYTHNLGGVNIVSKEAQRVRKGKILVKDGTISGYTSAFLIENTFEGPFVLDNVTTTGTTNRYEWTCFNCDDITVSAGSPSTRFFNDTVGVFDKDQGLFVRKSGTNAIGTKAILEILSNDDTKKLKLGSTRFFDLTEAPSYSPKDYDTQRYAVVDIGESILLNQASGGAAYTAKCWTHNGSGTVTVNAVVINCDEYTGP